MELTVVEHLMSESKNFVFIGETGSGKTEVAISLAVHMSGYGHPVHFFDMDQTKPLFRARDVSSVLEDVGVVVHYQNQHLDAPTVVSGVSELLADPGAHVILDVGGGANGANMIGQFSHHLNRPDSRVFYLVNPYRIWSGTSKDIDATLQKITSASRLRRVCLVANPNLGPDTTAEDVLLGERRIREMLSDIPADFLCVLDRLCPEIEGRVDVPVLPVTLSTAPEWL